MSTDTISPETVENAVDTEARKYYYRSSHGTQPFNEVTELPAELAKVVDRAVRLSRVKSVCGEFEEVAAFALGVPKALLVDSDGYSCRGFNKDGFNKRGYDRNGYDKDGFNYEGFNAEGFDKDGFDYEGFNTKGQHRDGGDRYRFDSQGYTKEGYDRHGYRASMTARWYAEQAAKDDSEFRFDQQRNPRPSLPNAEG